jgi:hypothetical protein
MAEVWQHVLGLILARRGFSIILCRQTQNILQNVDPQNEFSNTAFWDYLTFLDAYEGQLGQSEFCDLIGQVVYHGGILVFGRLGIVKGEYIGI